VIGINFDGGAVILVGGNRQKTLHDSQNPCTLTGKKSGRNLPSGTAVLLQVQNWDGITSLGFPFQSPVSGPIKESLVQSAGHIGCCSQRCVSWSSSRNARTTD
jgi:hypothetical protein